MIDPDAQRGALDAVLATRQATATASVAVFSALLASDPERAWRVSESVLVTA